MTLSQGEIPALDGPEDAISAKKISGHSAKTAVLEILSQEMLAKADSPPIPAIMEKEPLSMSSKVAAGNENLILASQHNTPWKCVTRCSPTNYNMLLFRTLNRDLNEPNANSDDIAPLFRDALMPLRSCLLSYKSCGRIYKDVVENPDRGAPGVCNFVDSRTKWFDTAVRKALFEGFTQVVVIAAGFDTRAYRLHPSGVQFFEVDLPHASAKKKKIVSRVLPDTEKYPRPHYIAADLSKVPLSEALLRAPGFDPYKKTLFTCEGLIYYLTPDAAHGLLASVADAAPLGSRLYFDFLHADALEGRVYPPAYVSTAKSVESKGEPFLSGIEPSPPTIKRYVQSQGFDLVELLSPRQMAATMLPHTVWSDELPPILSFFSFASVQLVEGTGKPWHAQGAGPHDVTTMLKLEAISSPTP